MRGLLKLLLEIVPFFDVLAEFTVPLFDVIVVETWGVRHGVHGFFHVFLALFVFISLSPCGVKCEATLVRDSQSVNKR